MPRRPFILLSLSLLVVIVAMGCWIFLRLESSVTESLSEDIISDDRGGHPRSTRDLDWAAYQLPEPFPSELEPYRSQILASVRPRLTIQIRREEETEPWASKFGGVPYLPAGETHPQKEEGRPYLLVAQINFADAPALPGFPNEGILQFFIHEGGDQHGCEHNFGDLYKRWAEDPSYQMPRADIPGKRPYLIRFYPEVTTDRALLSRAPSPRPGKADFFPIYHESRLILTVEEGPVSTGSYLFEETIGMRSWELLRSLPPSSVTEVEEYFWEHLTGGGGGTWHSSHLGGYADFQQQDPRGLPETSAPIGDRWILLLQIGSNRDDVSIGSGNGIAHLYILESDLRRRDFSRVQYQWDCT